MQTLSRGLAAYKKELQQQHRHSKSAELLQQTIAIKKEREAQEAGAQQIPEDAVTQTSVAEAEPLHQKLKAIQSLTRLVLTLNVLLIGALGWLLITTYGHLFS